MDTHVVTVGLALDSKVTAALNLLRGYLFSRQKVSQCQCSAPIHISCPSRPSRALSRTIRITTRIGSAPSAASTSGLTLLRAASPVLQGRVKARAGRGAEDVS
jgi:hypothetical protein